MPIHSNYNIIYGRYATSTKRQTISCSKSEETQEQGVGGGEVWLCSHNCQIHDLESTKILKWLNQVAKLREAKLGSLKSWNFHNSQFLLEMLMENWIVLQIITKLIYLYVSMPGQWPTWYTQIKKLHASEFQMARE